MLRDIKRPAFLFGCLATLLLASSVRSAKAEQLNVVPDSSNVTIGIGIGIFVDDEGNASNPVTGNPYGPGDLNPDDNVPVTFAALGNAVGQADPSVPPAVLAPFGVVPVLSSGLSTSLNGFVNVTPGGFSIDSANIGLNASGLWQSGANGTQTSTQPIAPAELGAYIDLSAVVAGTYILATLNGTQISINTTTGSLPAGGFDDLNGNLNLVTTTIAGFAAGAFSTAINSPITNVASTTELAGSYNVLGNIATLNIPSFSTSSFSDLSSVVPGLWAQITESGAIVATAVVPEPSSFVLLGGALVGLCLHGVRRFRSR